MDKEQNHLMLLMQLRATIACIQEIGMTEPLRQSLLKHSQSIRDYMDCLDQQTEVLISAASEHSEFSAEHKELKNQIATNKAKRRVLENALQTASIFF